MKTVPMTESEEFEGGSWRRVGAMIIVIRERGSHALPPGIEIDTSKLTFRSPMPEGKEEFRGFVVGWTNEVVVIKP